MTKYLGLLLCLALAGCGSAATTTTSVTSTATTFRPSNLGPPGDEAQAGHSATGCGVERWSIKTLTDPGANRVNLKPVSSTVAALTALRAPRHPTGRVAPVELTTYRLVGTIVFAKPEDDGDLHLVIADAAGHTMIVESPRASCAVHSVVGKQIAAVRKAVDAKFNTPGRARYTVNVPVIVTGVGFWDRLHNQTGVAKNGVELHPITAIQFPAGRRHRTPHLHLHANSAAD